MKTNIVYVKFENNDYGKEYAFRNDIEDLAVDDKVVLDTQYGFAVGTVMDIQDEEPKHVNVNKFVVQKIDISQHESRLEHFALVEKVKAKMEKRRKELEEINIFAILAKEDEEMKTLLDQYNELNK
ncbi:hypothetical protein [Bacillus sp. Bos-x628]|uniref:hypothetical protein n=1 Tax=Bacillus maqinnsis TaxID=3229854 RepID=UPI0033901A1D